MKQVPSILFVLLILVVLSVLPVLASNGGGEPGRNGGGAPDGLPNPLRTDNIVNLLNTILSELVTKIAPPLVGLMVIIGAFQILFAGGNPEQFALGKKTILYTVIGYAILFIATGITAIIKNLLGVQ
jgi:hypothetical protein